MRSTFTAWHGSMGHSGYDALIPVLETFGETNGDGLRWDDPAIDRAEMDEMLSDL